MNKFKKIVAIEPLNIGPKSREGLKKYAEEVIFAQDIPKNNQEIIKRIGDADAVLVSYTSKIEKEVLEQAENLRYIGMCCSLYSEESANVDIPFAREKGITVKGVRDYGDRGVVEYVIYQLVRILHGYDYPMWKEQSLEFTDLKVGMVGLGTSGGMVAEALKFLGADVSYFARSVKQDREEQGIHFKELHELLRDSEIIITCLNKNVILLHEEEFNILGEGKIMINTSIGPASDMDALKRWIENPENIFCCDTIGALGEIADEVMDRENVVCTNASAGGTTAQAFELLGTKALNNIREFLQEA